MNIEIDHETAHAFEIRPHKGYLGAFTRHRSPRALPNGSRIVKTAHEKHDMHRDGAQGAVLGSIYHPALGVLYFIEWDDKPRVAVAVIESKVAALS